MGADIFYLIFTLKITVLACFMQKSQKKNISLDPLASLQIPPYPQLQKKRCAHIFSGLSPDNNKNCFLQLSRETYAWMSSRYFLISQKFNCFHQLFDFYNMSSVHKSRNLAFFWIPCENLRIIDLEIFCNKMSSLT